MTTVRNATAVAIGVRVRTIAVDRPLRNHCCLVTIRSATIAEGAAMIDATTASLMVTRTRDREADLPPLLLPLRATFIRVTLQPLLLALESNR